MKLKFYTSPNLHGLKNTGFLFELPQVTIGDLPEDATLLHEIDIDVDEYALKQAVLEWREQYLGSKEQKRAELQLRELDR